MYNNLDLFGMRNLYVRCMQGYHVFGKSELSDAEFDALKRAIRNDSPDDPVLKLVGAPAPAGEHLKKVKIPKEVMMGSVANSDTHGEDYADGFQKWWGKVEPKDGIVASLKVDGLSVLLGYKDGRLSKAMTRGDGVVGDDITANVIRCQDIPFITAPQFTGWVRGELVIYTEDWKKLEATSDYTTARNAAAGIARSKSGENIEYLRFVAHDLIFAFYVDLEANTEAANNAAKKFLMLDTTLGFKIPQPIYLNTLPACEQFFLVIRDGRDKLPYEIDGIVFSLNDLNRVRQLGVDGESCWRGQVAWKFPALTGISKLKGVKLTVGHTGQINPTADLEPVNIGGVTVTSASLCNFDECERLDIAIDDTVEVSRQGDVIPKVIRVVSHGYDKNDRRAFAVLPPRLCPVCGGEVGRRKNVDGEDGVHLYCLNDECDAKATGKLHRWIKSLQIKELGTEVVDALVKAGWVSTVVDLYSFSSTRATDEIGNLQVNGKRLGVSKAKKILTNIKATQHLTIDQFLGSLGIKNLGKRKVQLIREAAAKMNALYQKGMGQDWFDFSDLNMWFSDALVRKGNLLGIPNIAREIQDDLARKRPLITELLNHITIKKHEKVEAVADAKLAGKSFCFTGCRMTPDETTRLAQLGGEEKSGVSKGLTYLVTKDPGKTSSKTSKAKELGTEVISYEQFKGMVK